MNWVQSYMINEMGTSEQEKQNLRAIINNLIQNNMVWMKQHDIIVGDKGMYWIVNYGLKGKNDINRLVRGMVVQKPPKDFSGDTLQLIKSFPFTRFFNQGESDDVAPVNLSNAEMLEKMDGSMIGIFFPTGDPNNPQWHTRKMVSTHEPDMNVRVSAFDGTRPKLMEIAGQYVNRLNFNEEDVAHTYVFELVHKSSAVITKYTEDQWGLYLLAARNIETHMEESESKLDEIAARVGAMRPQRWDAIADADEIMSMMKQIAGEVEDFEGVVFRDRETGSRMKLKDQDYVKKHHELGTLNFRRLIPRVLEGEAQEIIAYFPHAKQKVDLIQKRHDDYIDNAVKIIEKYKHKFAGIPRREAWESINAELDDNILIGLFMKSLAEEDVRSLVEKELLSLGSIEFEKETYQGLQTFKTASPRYLDLMGLRKMADEEDDFSVE